MADTIVLKLTLERRARKGGGDRYETEKTDKHDSFQIYLPQSICRIADVSISEFMVTVTPEA